MTFFKVRLEAIVPAVIWIFAEAQLAGQPALDRSPRIYRPASEGWTSRIFKPYEPRRVSPLNFQNSRRIFSLMRAGQLYLSLSDAIALALENNLDIQLERYVPGIARTEVERAEGGGFLRGLFLDVIEAPPGIGGPNGPLLTSLTAGSTPAPLVNSNFSDIALISQQQNDLSVFGFGLQPFSPGPLPPLYDPTISTLLNWEHASTPEFNTVVTGSNFLNTDTTTGNLGYVQGFSPGTQIGINFNNTRFTSNARTFTYNPVYNSSLALTVTQPLLRGFGRALNRRFIRIARQSQAIANLVFQQQVIDTVAGVARLYTDLVSLNEDVKVKEEQVRLAERLYQDNKNKVDEGTLAPIEMTRAQAQVAVSRQALISAQGLVQQQELVVKNYITSAGLMDSAIRESHVVVVDSVTVPEKDLAEPVQELFVEALRNRPDLYQAGIQIDNAKLYLKGSLNALRPQLDLVGFMQNNSLNGDLNPLVPVVPGVPLAVGGYGTTLEQIILRNHPTYGIGLQLSLPLRNRVAQADATRDELQLRQAEVRRKSLENQVRLEVANALVSMQAARAEYEASVQARILQEQSVDVEQQKFDVGLSTNYLVIQFQSFLAQARSTELSAKGAFAKARIALERALGRTLTVNHISIDEAYSGEVVRAPQYTPIR
jgi:outer membrane protein TolC